MKIQQIRNATVVLDYAGTRLLVDPYLAEQGAYPGFEGTVNSHLRNPTAPLAIPVDEIIKADAVILTHVHPDHWDEAAVNLIPKGMPIYTQSAADQAVVVSQGFTNVSLIEGTVLNGIKFYQTNGQHGSDEALQAIGEILGDVCGVVLQHPAEKTLYVAGDTIWNQHVVEALEQFTPEVILLNAGDAQVIGLGSIIMGKEDVWRVFQAAPHAHIVATHLEAVNHAVLTRKELRQYCEEKHMGGRVSIPADGETLSF
ncbi:MBL fold metallo-hydrolase [Pseudomonas sp. zbq_4]|uniref:MBL fold metallo-hydrolase n=1 Tax=Pseudomonas TaxID=286 RepID=UPI00370BA9D8